MRRRGHAFSHQVLLFPLTLLLPILLLLSPAHGQIAPACPSNFASLANSFGQSPCQVLSTLFGTCTNTLPFNLTALGDAFAGYAGPTSTDPSAFEYNQCLCSMPIYGLVSACETCQSKSPTSWVDWTASCNASFTGSKSFPSINFPQPVPPSTQIPPWANINFLNKTWSQAAVFTNVSSAASALASSASASPALSSLGAQPTSNGSGSNTGAIVGGVVGAVAVLALTGVGAFLLRRHYNARFVDDHHDRAVIDAGTPMTDKTTAPRGGGGGFFGPPGGPYAAQLQQQGHRTQQSATYGSFTDQTRQAPSAAYAAAYPFPNSGPSTSGHSYGHSQGQSVAFTRTGTATGVSLTPSSRTRSTSAGSSAQQQHGNPFADSSAAAPPVPAVPQRAIPEVQSDDTWNHMPDRYSSFHAGVTRPPGQPSR